MTELSNAAKAIAFKQYFGPTKTSWVTAVAGYDALVAGKFEANPLGLVPSPAGVAPTKEFMLEGRVYWAFGELDLETAIFSMQEDAERWQECMSYFSATQATPAAPPGYTADELERDNPYNP